jgi:5-methylcytosine-specific restriction enzyme subunit McrC
MKIHLKEHGSPADIPQLPADLRRAFEPLVTITDRSGNRSRVRPGAKVGVLRAGEVTVHVEPKIEISQLLFLVDYKVKPVAWSDPPADVEEIGDLTATVGDVYARLAERALSRGPLCGYRPATASLPVLKGRLRFADQVAARHGASFPFEVSYAQFGPDIPENRVLKAAAIAALSLPRLRLDTRTRLGRIMRRLAAVAPLAGPRRSEVWRPTRLNTHYVDALRMAETILRGSAFGPAPGAVPASGFVLDMAVVFENFVCTALGEAMRARITGTWTPRPPMHLDVAGRVPIKPDFTFMVNGTPVAIADAKYKAGFAGKRQDIYQMVVYCAALGVPRGHLIYAEGGAERLEHEVRHTSVRVVQHALDLTVPRGRLLAAVDRLAEELVADIPAPARARSAPNDRSAPLATIPSGGRA